MAIMLGDTKINIIKGTTLLDALKDYMEYREWDDELQSNDDDTAQILASSYEIDDQNYNFYLECHQNLDTFRCYFYSPFKINTQKFVKFKLIEGFVSFFPSFIQRMLKIRF